jgi:hypothetical protein
MTLVHAREDGWLDAPVTARAGAPAMPPPHALQVLRRHAIAMCAVLSPSAVPATPAGLPVPSQPAVAPARAAARARAPEPAACPCT